VIGRRAVKLLYHRAVGELPPTTTTLSGGAGALSARLRIGSDE
jgi:hypothetical protein